MIRVPHVVVLVLAGGLATGIAPPAAAQVDYHRAQQAGKVWERKQADRNLQQRRNGAHRAGQSAAPTDAHRAAALAANRADYDQLVRSVGRRNADRWLDFKAREVANGGR